MASQTNWIIADHTMVHVGDEVIGAGGHRGRITGVSPTTGWPVITYEDGPIKGVTVHIHPQNIQRKVR